MSDIRVWPKISIVTPNLNHGQFLEVTIRSVLSQNYPNLEYIIIDGGSTDNSVEIIKKYADRLAYWVSEPDKGQGNALNKGFSHSTGEILAWLNSIDTYLPWTFSVVAQCFNTHRDINWITGCNSWWNVNGQLHSPAHVYKNIYDFLLGNYKWLQQESTFWRRSLWEKAGERLNERYNLQVDGELWCRFFLLDELWHVDSILGGYRDHPSRRTSMHYNEVIEAIETAISALKNNCPDEIRKRAEILEYLKIIKRLFNFIRINDFFPIFFRKFYDNISYKRLVFKDGSGI